MKKRFLYLSIYFFGLLIILLSLRFIIPTVSIDINIAKKFGIISKSIINNYSCFNLIINYLSIVLLWPILSLFLIQSISSKTSNNTPIIYSQAKSINKFKNTLEYLIIITLLSLLLAYPNYFWINNFNSWEIYFENGYFLSIVNDLLKNKKLFTEIFHVYGSLMILPLYLLMKFATPHIIVFKIYSYFLNVAGFFLLYLFLKKIEIKKILLYAIFACFILIFFPIKSGLNLTIFRPLSGLIPLLFIISYLNKQKKYFFLLSGFSILIPYLYSQEIGSAMFISNISLIFIYAFSQKNKIKILFSLILNYLIGVLSGLSIIILLDILKIYDIKNTLPFSSFALASLLGHFAKPYPAPTSLSNAIILYSPIILYSIIGFHLLIDIFNKKNITHTNFLKFSLWIFGIIIFIHDLLRFSLDGLLLDTIPLMLIIIIYINEILKKYIHSTKQYILNSSILLLCFFSSYYLLGNNHIKLKTLTKSLKSEIYRFSKPKNIPSQFAIS